MLRWEMSQVQCPGAELCLCPSCPRVLAGFGLQGPFTITSCPCSQQAPDDAGTDTLVCSCLPCRCPLRARPPELRLLPDTAAAGQVPPPHRAQPVLPQLPPARAAGSAPRPPAPLPEVTALSPRPAPCGRCAMGRTGGCATARGAPGSETLLSNGAQTIRGAAGVGHVPCVLCHVPCVIGHVPCALCHVPYAMCIVSCALCHVTCALCHVPCVMCLIPCALCHLPCVLCHVPCAMCPMPCAMCPVPCAIGHAPCSLQDLPGHTALGTNREPKGKQRGKGS